MNPVDPKQPYRPGDEDPMAPPFVNENIEREAVDRGLDVAENEVRQSMIEIYEDTAMQSEDPEEYLDDIDYEDGQPAHDGPDKEPGSI
jgi:hypothetical protein